MMARWKTPRGIIAGEPVKFHLNDAVFLHASSGEGERAVGSCLGVAEVNNETLGQRVHEMKRALSKPRLEWKIVGRPTLVRWCVDFLERAGETIAKSVSREDLVEVKFFPEVGRLLVTKETKVVPHGDVARRKIRVLSIDDSPTIHVVLKKMLASDPAIEVVDTILDPRLAEEAIDRLKPDVITLDIHMPHLNGVALLKRFWPRQKIPTIMISALSQEDGPYVFEALESGAFDYIQKPSLAELDQTKSLLIERIHAAAQANVTSEVKNEGVLHDDVGVDLGRMIGIGSSTGGTEALRNILTRLPANVPPILIVQHIPPVFSAAFAKRMDALCRFRVKEAEDGDAVAPSTAYIAPGGRHMRIERSTGGGYRIRIDDTDPVNRHKPSVDILFNSLAENVGANAVGVILTGMGNDGASGLLKMRTKGAATIGQDQATSVVYGMPREAAALGAVEDVRPLCEIAARILHLASRPLRKTS